MNLMDAYEFSFSEWAEVAVAVLLLVAMGALLYI